MSEPEPKPAADSGRNAAVDVTTPTYGPSPIIRAMEISGAERAFLEAQRRVLQEAAKAGLLLTQRTAAVEQRAMTCRELPIRPDSVDEKTRSVGAVIATGERVAVWDWQRWEVIDEILIIRGAELEEQVVLLENHQRRNSDDVMGSVRQIRRTDDQVEGRIYFADGDERAERTWQKYRDGHMRSVSAGYEQLDYVDIAPGKTKVVEGRRYTAGERTLRITLRWRLGEVSVLPFGADGRAKTRSGERQPTMNERLRAYLEAIGLRTEATEEQARHFLAMLGGRQAEIANVLESWTESHTSELMARAALRELGVDPEKPWESAEGQRSGSDSGQDPDGQAGQRTPAQAAGDGDGQSNRPDEDALRREGAQAEADRRQQIRELAEMGDGRIPAELVERAESETWPVDRARREFLQAFREAPSASVGRSAPGIHLRDHNRDCTARTVAAGLLISQSVEPVGALFGERFGWGSEPPQRLLEQDAERGHQFARLSAVDICRECARIDTGRWYRDPEEAFRAAVSGATLSYVFTTNIYARLIAGWEEVGDTTAGWVDEEDVPNFLQQEDISLSFNARLQPLPRGGTAKHAVFSDKHETYRIKRYAKQFVVDEQDIIDDRLGSIMKMPSQLGSEARRLRPDMVYSLILENPNLVADGKAVFHADHGNLGSAVLSSDNLKTAISAMGKQRENNKVLNITPRYLLVPAALEWKADELCTTNSLAKLFADSDDPVFSTENLIARRRLVPVMDDRLGASGVIDPRTEQLRTGSDTQWLLAAGGRKSIRVAYRRGTGRRPQLRRNTLDKGQWGIGWDINFDIGVAFMCFRPWYESTGTG